MTATLDDEVADLRRANAELQQRLNEGLAREAATVEILQVINSSPGDLASVFDAMLDKATLLSEAAFGVLWTMASFFTPWPFATCHPHSRNFCASRRKPAR